MDTGASLFVHVSPANSNPVGQLISCQERKWEAGQGRDHLSAAKERQVCYRAANEEELKVVKTTSVPLLPTDIQEKCHTSHRNGAIVAPNGSVHIALLRRLCWTLTAKETGDLLLMLTMTLF